MDGVCGQTRFTKIWTSKRSFLILRFTTRLWLAMGYIFSWQASLASFSPYFLMFSYEPKLPTLIQRNVMGNIKLDDPNLRFQTCEQRITLFQHVMPMAINNLAIVQHQDTLWYVTIQRGEYWLQVCKFESRDYVCVLIANNTDYFGCNYKTCYLANAKGFTFCCVVVEGPRWLDMEGSCA